MRCPYCSSEDSQVKDSRPAEDGAAIRRRRICPDCGGRFTTFERVQLRELMVVKKTGRKAPFDRDKLLKSFEIALRKRPVDRDRIERAVSGIVRRLESSGETEIASEATTKNQPPDIDIIMFHNNPGRENGNCRRQKRCHPDSLKTLAASVSSAGTVRNP